VPIRNEHCSFQSCSLFETSTLTAVERLLKWTNFSSWCSRSSDNNRPMLSTHQLLFPMMRIAVTYHCPQHTLRNCHNPRHWVYVAPPSTGRHSGLVSWVFTWNLKPQGSGILISERTSIGIKYLALISAAVAPWWPTMAIVKSVNRVDWIMLRSDVWYGFWTCIG